MSTGERPEPNDQEHTMSMSTETPIRVYGEIMPGTPDPTSLGRFANSDRAEQYARSLTEAPNSYSGVFLIDANDQTWEVPADVLLNSAGEEVAR